MESKQARNELVNTVREDIKQVLSRSWELQQVLKTAPKASPEAAHRLSQPVRPRMKHPGDSCSFASYTAGQLSKQRTKREQQRRAEREYEAAKQEALEGFRRAKAQEERLVFEQHQQEVMQQQEVARHTAWRVTQLAKCDLQVLKHKQEQQRQQAALVHQRMTCWNK